MSQAAYEKKVKIETSPGVFEDVAAETASLNLGGDVLDDTEMATNAGFRSRILGLHDWSVSLSVRWSGTNAALAAIRNNWANRTNVKVQYLPDGTTPNGFQGEAVVESFNLGGDVGSLEMVDISLQADGAIGAAS